MMSWFKIQDVPMPKINVKAILDYKSKAYTIENECLIPLDYFHLTQYIFKLLHTYKNPASFKYVLIAYQYAMKSTDLPMKSIIYKYINLSHPGFRLINFLSGFKKVISKTVNKIIYSYQMATLNMLSAYKNDIYPTDQIPSYIIIKKIIVYT